MISKGADVGVGVGISVLRGAKVGRRAGDKVGTAVGVDVGVDVGLDVGRDVGLDVGCVEGLCVLATVGTGNGGDTTSLPSLPGGASSAQKHGNSPCLAGSVVQKESVYCAPLQLCSHHWLSMK